MDPRLKMIIDSFEHATGETSGEILCPHCREEMHFMTSEMSPLGCSYWTCYICDYEIEEYDLWYTDKYADDINRRDLMGELEGEGIDLGEYLYKYNY